MRPMILPIMAAHITPLTPSSASFSINPSWVKACNPICPTPTERGWASCNEWTSTSQTQNKLQQCLSLYYAKMSFSAQMECPLTDRSPGMQKLFIAQSTLPQVNELSTMFITFRMLMLMAAGSDNGWRSSMV